MKASDPRKISEQWFDFQNKYNLTKDKALEILIEKLKAMYQIDLKSKQHAQELDALISELKQRKTWT